METIRWYDKNPLMKDVFEFIQKLDFTNQSEIAKDILQILVKDLDINLDDSLNKISENYNYTCKRWYDNNIDLYSSFEVLKQLSAEQQKYVMNRVIESALLMYFGGDSD
jgi:hypothetical protein